ncbi:Periplasmic pH-dependent serine endoprotease DegQ precursor [Stieleria neptunia]|uniref:Periplasmic pH-dependent serine endoprotease DegQ n=1 Tax=Stieleria neptunia TaxID=2527979 RepID=A0A518I182_9BACT|nr:trypsin-like peptidase domain-containing protein [Stieleria neptunia]QDV46787.1 Periplasmic pH-dependent serine endoprotease DegQ precursor [Stieleria neptunia]
MDRTPEGPQAEKPSDEIPISEVPISTTETPSDDLADEQPFALHRLPSTGDTPPAPTCNPAAGRSGPDSPDGDGSTAAPRTLRIERDESETPRTVIFHRFHPQASGPARPHFEPADEPVDDAITDDAIEMASGGAISDRLAFDTTPQPVSPQPASDGGFPQDSVPQDSDPQESCSDITDIDVSDIVVSPEPERHSIATKHRQHARRSDPVRHGVVMLVTVLVMLAAARYVLPSIVEEIRYAQHRGQLRAEFEVAGEGLKNVSLDTLSQAYQMVNAAAGPSVVHIDIHRTAHEAIAHPDVPGAPAILISDQGSGVVVDADGYILTNRHVVAGSDQISVTLSDGRTVDAMIVGTDELTDLAVLKVNADRLMPIPWGDSERIRVGSPVWAIGSPFGLDRTVTFGILSGKHRVVRAKDRYQDFMQSDVAVNPGNSGGPLVDSRGTLIGINTAIVGDTYQGVSFAIPSGIAKKIYLQLREKGSIERGWLGVSLVEVPNDRLQGENHRIRGAMIAALADQNSGAARAGLKSGDLVISLDDQKVRDVDHLMQLIGNAMAGTAIHLSVIRDGQGLEFDVLLGRRPPPLDLR